MMQLQAGGGQCPDAEEAKHAPDGGQYEEDNERLGPSRKRLKRGNPGKVCSFFHFSWSSYRDVLKGGPQVLWIWGEKVAFSCLLQAGERNFSSHIHRTWGPPFRPSLYLPNRLHYKLKMCPFHLLMDGYNGGWNDHDIRVAWGPRLFGASRVPAEPLSDGWDFKELISN